MRAKSREKLLQRVGFGPKQVTPLDLLPERPLHPLPDDDRPTAATSCKSYKRAESRLRVIAANTGSTSSNSRSSAWQKIK